jgi:hypothetical protein
MAAGGGDVAALAADLRARGLVRDVRRRAA